MSTPPGSAIGAAPAPAVSAEEIAYVGLVTRAIAFALDGAVVNLVATVVGVGAALILSLLHLPHPLKEILVAIGGAAYIAWVFGYFVVFWSTTGQTPGARVMQFRVLTSDRARLKPRRAVVRCAGVLAAALPLFARVLTDRVRRQAPGAPGLPRAHDRCRGAGALRRRYPPRQEAGGVSRLAPAAGESGAIRQRSSFLGDAGVRAGSDA